MIVSLDLENILAMIWVVNMLEIKRQEQTALRNFALIGLVFSDISFSAVLHMVNQYSMNATATS